MPLSPQGVLEGVFDFGAIKSTLARQVLKLTAGSLQTLRECVLRSVPTFFAADALFGAGRQAIKNFGEAKIFVDLLQQGGEGDHLWLNLCFGTKNVPVILGKGTNTHDAVQAAGGLISMTLAKFTKTQWQVTVTLDALLENQNMTGAIHRLQGIVALLRFGHKHVFTVLVPVPRFLPKVLIQNLWSLDFKIPVVAIDVAHVLLHLLPQNPALGVPKHRARGVLIDVEKIKLTSQLSVVSLFRLLQHGEVLLQVLFAGPSRSINALQHFIAVISPPISAGHFHQFKVL